MWARVTVLLASFLTLVSATESADQRLDLWGKENMTSIFGPKSQHGERQSKIFPIFPFYTVVRFSNIECNATNGLLGTCYLSAECRQKAGTAFGSCARRLGVCCVLTRNCGGIASNSNNTYYRSPGFPGNYAGGPRCTVSIAKVRSEMCQVRLSFTKFVLAQPAANGSCITDYFTVTGSDTSIPRICGVNTGQHLFLKFLDDGSPIQLTIITTSTVPFDRQWDITVSQHTCADGAPNGCLQYYTGISGRVNSFNYAPTANPAAAGATRQLVDVAYSVCVRPQVGYCGIEWTQTNSEAFTVSRNSSDSVLGNQSAAQTGSQCTGDFIIIPNAMQNLISVGADRFCGNALLPTRSFITPFTITVVDDESENGDFANRGFQLDYRQIVCS